MIGIPKLSILGGTSNDCVDGNRPIDPSEMSFPGSSIHSVMET